MRDRPLPPKPILIPEAAECVFRGELFDVYQWPQTQFDGTVETYEMLKRPDTVYIVAIDGDEIIVVDEEQANGDVRTGKIPGGRVDDSDESILAAAKRELLEETGLEFQDWHLLMISQPEPKIEWFKYVFVAQHKIAEHKPKHDGGERISVRRADFAIMKQKPLWGFRQGEVIFHGESLDEFIRGVEKGARAQS